MLGLGTSLVKGGKVGRTYIKDGLKLYMPYRGDNTTKGTQFVGTGSTSFDGGDYINIPTITLTGAFTVSAWIYPDSVTEAMIVVGDTDSQDNIRMNTATVMRYIINNSSTDWTHGLTFTANEWQYMTWTRDVSNVNRMYRNGILGGTTDTKSGDFTPTIIGAKGVPSTFPDYTEGKMKNVAIWERALTATEVQNVMYKTYAEVSDRLESGLVSWWSLETSSTDNPAG